MKMSERKKKADSKGGRENSDLGESSGIGIGELLSHLVDGMELDEIYASEQAATSRNTRRYEPPIRRQNSNNDREREGTNRDTIRQITKFNADNEDLYSEMESGDDELSYGTPTIVARVGNQACNILIDSGSEITAISENCYKNIASTINVPLLPVTNTTVAVAVGNKRYRVKQQALVPVEFPDAEQTIEMTCLIIPDLNSDILAGCDWLRQNKVDIDFGDRTVMLQGRIKIPMVNETADLVDDMTVGVARVNVCRVETGNIHRGKLIRHRDTEPEIRGVVENCDVRETEKEQLYKLLVKHEDILSECPGRIKSYVHKMEMIDREPFHINNYPIPLKYRQDVEDQIEEMLNWGVIRKEKANYISPLVVVKKKDASARICLDARALNKRIKKDFVGPPNSSEILQNFRRGMVLSTIDLSASYWQIAIDKDDAKYIGFIYEGEAYVFTRVPFGLSTGMAPVYLQFHESVPQPIDTYTKYPQSECREEDHQVVVVAARERLLSKAQRRASRLEKSKKLVTFREGDAVLVRRHDQSSAADKVIKKFFLLFDGPFWISKQVGPNSYILKTAEGVELPKQNVVNLRPYQEMPVELE
nr:unnamed protein product [Callosobruchus analis]